MPQPLAISHAELWQEEDPSTSLRASSRHALPPPAPSIPPPAPVPASLESERPAFAARSAFGLASDEVPSSEPPRPRRPSLWVMPQAEPGALPDSIELAVRRYLEQPPVELEASALSLEPAPVEPEDEPDRASLARISVVRRVVRRSRIVESVSPDLHDDRR